VQEDKVCEINMKNLTFTIDKKLQEVTFTYRNHSSIFRLVQESQITQTLEQYYANLVQRCVTVEEVKNVVNSGDQRFERVELIFKDVNGLPLVSVLKSQTPLAKKEIDAIEEEYRDVCDYNKKIDAYNKQLISATNHHEFMNAANYLV
jgi:hypothetical protein